MGEATRLKRGSGRGDSALLVVHTLVVVGSALALGGAVPIMFLPFGSLAIVAAGALSLRGSTGVRLALPLTLIALGLYSLVQALPLPPGLVTRLSPTAGDVWARCLLPLGETVSSASLSLDPSSSTFEGFKWCSYAASLLVAAEVSRSRSVAASLGIVFGSAVIVALVALGHWLTNAVTVFGVYAPKSPVTAGQVGPFINPNNLAGYLNLGALIGIGLTLSRQPVVPRPLLGAGVIAIVTVALRTASRGGIAALALGVLGFAWWSFFVARGGIASRRVVSGLITGLLAIGAVFAWLGADASFWGSLLSDNADKLKLPIWSVPMIREHLWFGIGRGAFGSVFFAYRPPILTNQTFTHPENVVVQWVSEWGVIVTLMAFSALAYALWPTARLVKKSTVAGGAFFALFALFAQNFVDLGLELGAVGIAFASVLGALIGGVPRSRTQRGRTWPLWIVRLGLAVGLIAGGMFALGGARLVEDDRRMVAALVAVAESNPCAETVASLSRAVRTNAAKHPADYYFPLAGAYAARLERSNPIPWLQRALERGPTVGRTHLLLGEILFERRLKNQGMMEMKLALEYEPGLAPFVAQVLVARTQDTADLLRAVPQGPEGVAVLDAFARKLYEVGALRTADDLDREALARTPSAYEPRRRLLENRLTSLEYGTDFCEDRVLCEEETADHIREADLFAPSSSLSVRSSARVDVLYGDLDRALDTLESGCSRPVERSLCLRDQILVLEKLKRFDDLPKRMEELTASSCARKSTCADAHQFNGRVYQRTGRAQVAVGELEEAARLEPTIERWLELADAAERAGLPRNAVRGLEAAIALGAAQKDPSLSTRLARLKQTPVLPLK